MQMPLAHMPNLNGQPADGTLKSTQHDCSNELDAQTWSLSSDYKTSSARTLSLSVCSEQDCQPSSDSVLSQLDYHHDLLRNQPPRIPLDYHPFIVSDFAQNANAIIRARSVPPLRKPSQDTPGSTSSTNINVTLPDPIPYMRDTSPQSTKTTGILPTPSRRKTSHHLGSHRKPSEARANNLHPLASTPQVRGQSAIAAVVLHSPLLIHGSFYP